MWNPVHFAYHINVLYFLLQSLELVNPSSVMSEWGLFLTCFLQTDAHNEVCCMIYSLINLTLAHWWSHSHIHTIVATSHQLSGKWYEDSSVILSLFNLLFYTVVKNNISNDSFKRIQLILSLRNICVHYIWAVKETKVLTFFSDKEKSLVCISYYLLSNSY